VRFKFVKKLNILVAGYRCRLLAKV